MRLGVAVCLASLSLLMLSGNIHHADALSVMAVDLGSEFMKIAIVKPGVPMEIALNKESRRKTPVIVAMRNGERLIGDPAVSVSVKFPKLAFWYLIELLGKKADNPQVALFKEKFPYYDIQEDKERGTIVFKYDENTSYTPEELVAMLLEKAKDIASDFAEQPVTDAVITVPAYFNQAERRAMIRAAEFAGVKVLQIMNDNAAVALNYGIFRSKSFNASQQLYMFYDMGAGSSTATIVAYQNVKNKNAVTGLLDSYPQLTVKGVGYDRTLGGVAFQMRLRDHLAKVFNNQKKTKSDVTKNPRAMAKLFKEAGRVKRVLSANSEHFAQVEGLIDEVDFRAKVTREEFENLCKDLFERVSQPIESALKQSQITLGEINEIILMGGGTRIPKVQEQILKASKREEVSKSINTDEAAALGAVYQAAHLSKGFRVKKFNVRDANLYPIQVEFERTKKDESGAESTKTVKRTLFGRLNPFPQKKVMTFNKHLKDFGFTVGYGDLSFLSQDDQKVFGATELSQVNLKGVETANTKHAADKESKGVKAHFKMDESGILTLDKVESVFEQPPPPEDKKPEEESTLSKAETSGWQSYVNELGSTISNLFGGSEKKEVKDEEVKTEEASNSDKSEEKPSAEKTSETKPETAPPSDESKDDKKTPDSAKTEEKKEADADKKEDKKDEKTEEKKDDKKKDDKGKTDSTKDDSKNKTDDKASAKKAEEKKAPPKPTIHKEVITMTTSIVDVPEPSSDSLKASRKKIEELREKDIEKAKREKARNELESFIYNSKEKMYDEDYEKCSKEDERTNIKDKLSEASDWMEMEVDENTKRQVLQRQERALPGLASDLTQRQKADDGLTIRLAGSDFEGKLSTLKSLMGDLSERVKEKQERPKFIEALKGVMNYTEHFHKTMKNFTGDDLPFTQVEYDTLGRLITDTKKWNETATESWKKIPLTEKPKYLISDIATKIGALDREVKYLVNKAKLYRPKPKPAEKTNTTASKEDDKSENTTKEGDEKKASETKEETKKKEETTTTPPPKFEPPLREEPEASKSKKSKAKKQDKPEETLELDGATEDKSSSQKTEDNTSTGKDDGEKKSDSKDGEKKTEKTDTHSEL